MKKRHQIETIRKTALERTHITHLLFICIIFVLRIAMGAKVLSEQGNIVLMNEDGHKKMLTKSGVDFDPVLSPDGQKVAFVRSFRPPEDDSGHGYTNCSAWVVNANGTNPRCLVTGKYAGDSEGFLCDLHGLHFSPDGNKLYFQSIPRATTAAIHVIDLATEQHQYITMGSLLRVIPCGQYKGNLLVQQHRYFMSGGSYDWVWLMNPQGEEIGAVSQGEGAYGGGIDSFWSMYVR